MNRSEARIHRLRPYVALIQLGYNRFCWFWKNLVDYIIQKLNPRIV